MKIHKDTQQFIKEIWGDHCVDIEKIKGDASTREYYKVIDERKTIVICRYASSSKESFSNFLTIQKIYEENHIRVPKVSHSNKSIGHMAQEYLGEETFLQRISSISNKQEEYKLYRQLIDILIQIQSIDAATNMTTQPWTQKSFDKKKLMSEVDFTCHFFLEKYLTRTKESIEPVKQHFDKLCQIMAHQKKCMTHRDFHSRNIMMLGNSPVIIDFQDAMMGIPQYDLVSLLEDCYYKISTSNKESLKKYYWDHGPHIKKFQKDFHDFLYFYDLTLIQRSFKAIGSFAYLFEDAKNPHYLKYIGMAYENIRETLLKYHSFKDLKEILNRLYYGN